MSDELHISWKGDHSLESTAEVLSEVSRLLDVLTEHVCGDADAIDWRLANLRFVCDRCGADRPAEHKDWQQKGGDDFCPACWDKEEERCA